MSSQREERLVKAWRKPLIVGLGTGPRTPNQLSDSIKELREWGIELTKEEEKEARDISLQKRDNLEVFLASLVKTLEKQRTKESKMRDLSSEERVKDLRRKMELREKGEIKAKQIEPMDTEGKIEKFIDRVLSAFEELVEVEENVDYMIKRSFIPDPLLTVGEWGEAMKSLEKMGFVIMGSDCEPVPWMRVRLYREKELSLKERAEILRKKMRIKNKGKREAQKKERGVQKKGSEERIETFLNFVVGRFERELEKNLAFGNSIPKIVKEFSMASLNETESKEIKNELEKLGLSISGSDLGEQYVRVYLGEYEHPVPDGPG